MTTGSTYLDSIKQGAIETWHEHQILPSLTGAQAALESGWGTSSLSKPPHNNNFGIKASDDWTGRTVWMPTKEWNGSTFITVNAEFRAYDDINDSVKDHGAFFTSTEWRRNNYKAVVGEQDYIKGARALQSSGYATDPGYANKLIKIIENYKLFEWDKEALSGTPTTTSTQTVAFRKYVGGELTEAGRSHVENSQVSVIGDSLGVGTMSPLSKLIPNSNYDVKGSRQITHPTDSLLDATKSLQSMKNSGALKPILVVIIGTNRGLTAGEIDNFVSIAGPDTKILWVETASYVNHAQQVNEEINQATKRHSNVYDLAWSKIAGPIFSEIYSTDNIHMTPSGYQLHAEYIAQAIYEIETGAIDGKSAQTARVEYEGLAGYKLNEDGTVEYNKLVDGKIIKVTEQTGLKGLSTNGKTNYIFNNDANTKWNPQNGNQTADWIEGKYENMELTGLELLKAAGHELMMRSEPETLYRIKLSRLPENIAIGSEGTIIDHESTPPLYIRARVIEIITSETNPENDEAIIGNVVEVQPLEKTLTLQIQQQLQQAREELAYEWKAGGEIRAEIESTGPTIFSYDDSQTQLIMRVFKGTEDITEEFLDFRWSRDSGDSVKDAEYNQVLAESENSNTLIVNREDILHDESIFTCKVYDSAGDLVHQSNSKLKVAVTAIWTETEEPPARASEGSKWVNPTTGEQQVKVNGTWEKQVDQTQIFNIENHMDSLETSISTAEQNAQQALADVGLTNDLANEAKTLAQTAQEKAETAVTEAITEAQRLDGLLKTTTETYTDTKVTEEIGKVKTEYIDVKLGDYVKTATYESGVDGLEAKITNAETNAKEYADAQIKVSADGMESRFTKLEGMEIGGRNLVINSGNKISNTLYPTAEYELSEPTVVGQTYTYQIKGTLKPSSDAWLFFDSSGNTFGALIVDEKYNPVEKIYYQSFVATSVTSRVKVYSYPNASGETASIEWVKLEKGNKATDWTPAPEDLVGQSEYKTFIGEYNQSAEGWNTTNAYVTDNKTQLNNVINNYNYFKRTIDTIGDSGTNIAQMVMTDSLIQTSILSSYNAKENNLISDSKSGIYGWANIFLTNAELKNTLKPNTNYTISYEVELVQKINGASSDFDYRSGRLFHTSDWVIGNDIRDWYVKSSVGDKYFQVSSFTTPSYFGTSPLYIYGARNNVNNINAELIFNNIIITEDIQSQVTQLSNSWALTLKSGGDLKTAINATTDGIRLLGKNILLDGNVTMQTAFIDNLTANTAFIGKIQAIEIDASKITTNLATLGNAIFNGVNSRVKLSSVGMDVVRSDSSYSSRFTDNGVELWRDNIKVGSLVSLNSATEGLYAGLKSISVSIEPNAYMSVSFKDVDSGKYYRSFTVDDKGNFRSYKPYLFGETDFGIQLAKSQITIDGVTLQGSDVRGARGGEGKIVLYENNSVGLSTSANKIILSDDISENKRRVLRIERALGIEDIAIGDTVEVGSSFVVNDIMRFKPTATYYYSSADGTGRRTLTADQKSKDYRIDRIVKETWSKHEYLLTDISTGWGLGWVNVNDIIRKV